MILTAKPGTIVNAPTAAEYTLRFKTPFSAMEVSAGVLTVEFVDPNGTPGVYSASADGADIILEVTANMFSPGLWELNPVAIISGKPRVFPIAVGLNVVKRGIIKTSCADGFSAQ